MPIDTIVLLKACGSSREVLETMVAANDGRFENRRGANDSGLAEV